MSATDEGLEVLEVLSSAGVGSVFTKTPIGWNVAYVDGGTVIHVQGATIADALASHGAQVVHPKSRAELAADAVADAVARDTAEAIDVPAPADALHQDDEDDEDDEDDDA